MRQHTDPSFPCKTCGKAFDELSDFKTHIKREHKYTSAMSNTSENVDIMRLKANMKYVIVIQNETFYF